MASRKAALKDLVKPIESAEEFSEWVEKSDTILVGELRRRAAPANSCATTRDLPRRGDGGGTADDPTRDRCLKLWRFTSRCITQTRHDPTGARPYRLTALNLTPAVPRAVLDVHKKWCGRCEVMQPTFERLYLDNDEADKRVKFLSVRRPAAGAQCDESAHTRVAQLDDSLLTEEQRKALEPTLHEGCKPLFLVYKVRARPADLRGVPSSNMSLRVQHKVVIGKVQGVNAPEIVTLVNENIFPVPEEE